MADSKNTNTTANKGTVIEVVGPKDENNGAQLFLLQRENADNLELAPGNRVTVGDGITKEEGERLLRSATWNFRTVEK